MDSVHSDSDIKSCNSGFAPRIWRRASVMTPFRRQGPGTRSIYLDFTADWSEERHLNSGPKDSFISLSVRDTTGKRSAGVDGAGPGRSSTSHHSRP